MDACTTCHFRQYPVYGIFRSSCADVKFPGCLHRCCSQKKAVLDFQSGFVNQLRPHDLPQFPVWSVLEQKDRLAIAFGRRNPDFPPFQPDGCRGFRGGPKIRRVWVVDRLFAKHTPTLLLLLILTESGTRPAMVPGSLRVHSA
jgi:hypothetical protein